MHDIIQQTIREFINKMQEIFSLEEKIHTLAGLESALQTSCHEFIRKMIKEYLELLDKQIRCEKEERRKEGLAIHRNGDNRSILTGFGSLDFCRTYYRDNKRGGYGYPLDQMMGIDAYERISLPVAVNMTNHAADLSYEKSNQYAARGQASRQTVKNKLRKLDVFEEAIPARKKIKTLYLSADEDHVALQNGKNVMVPLITAYEGTEKVSKGRNHCINKKYFGAYGMKTEALWEKVYDWVTEAYDYGEIKDIYIHGDGAGWIKKGTEILYGSKFVLDRYHLNQAVMRGTGAQPEFREDIREALRTGEKEWFEGVMVNLMLNAGSEEEKEKIIKLRRYVRNHWAGIVIRTKEDCGGCCAEGQVSHVLSDRLSSRPMGWSEKGLGKMVSLRVYRANKNIVGVHDFKTKGKEPHKVTIKAARKVRKMFHGYEPDKIGNLTVLENGKNTQLKKALTTIKYGGMPV